MYGIHDARNFNSGDISSAKVSHIIALQHEIEMQWMLMGSQLTGYQQNDERMWYSMHLPNSSGELSRASWNCPASFGHFLEIGLRGITNNMRLNMRPPRNSMTFSFINNYTLLV
jgi:hypothetical protein